MNKTAIVVSALALSAPAHAVEFSLGAGYTRFAETADGVYRQEAYPHWMDMDSPSLSVGVSFKPSNIRYNVEFLYLGDLYIQGMWVADNEYNPANYDCVGAGTCTAYVGQVRSNVAGLVFSAARDVPIFGIPFYAEAGIFANVQKVKINVMQPDGTIVAEAEREHQINYGPVLGFGIRYSGVDLGLRFIYLDDSSEGDPITPPAPYAMSFMYKVSF